MVLVTQMPLVVEDRQQGVGDNRIRIEPGIDVLGLDTYARAVMPRSNDFGLQSVGDRRE